MVLFLFFLVLFFWFFLDWFWRNLEISLIPFLYYCAVHYFDRVIYISEFVLFVAAHAEPFGLGFGVLLFGCLVLLHGFQDPELSIS